MYCKYTSIVQHCINTPTSITYYAVMYVPRKYTCGNGLLSTLCLFSCIHPLNWANLFCACFFPCLAYMDEEAWEDYTDQQTLLYERVFNFRLCLWTSKDIGFFKPKTPCAYLFSACFCPYVCCEKDTNEVEMRCFPCQSSASGGRGAQGVDITVPDGPKMDSNFTFL